MALSSNTLIHLTPTKDGIKGILECFFKISYCRESLVLGGKPIKFRVPMLSFCDIPLSEVKTHISKYGNYGIGMTKEWGKQQGMNPVLYVEQNSYLSSSYSYAVHHYTQDRTLSTWTNEEKAISDIARYIKNYEGTLSRKGKTIENYRFSDEREWRYVPPYSESCEMIVDDDDFDKNKQQFNSRICDMRLKFTANDIKYIIINDDSEVTELIEHIRKTRGNDNSHIDIDRLTTRIFTVEQIKSDI